MLWWRHLNWCAVPRNQVSKGHDEDANDDSSMILVLLNPYCDYQAKSICRTNCAITDLKERQCHLHEELSIYICSKNRPKIAMTSEMHLNVCLDVAVDHRIKRLFKPVPQEQTDHSNHVSRIEQRGRLLKRSRDEIEITAKLAGPKFKGGIAIVLQQPRHNHPFEHGINSVIEDCETLHALYEVFSTVSCGTLDIRNDISVIDLLPYMPDNVADIDNAVLKESFKVSAQAICDKAPKVLLCAGKIWMPEREKYNSLKGDARELESVGVGQTFGSTSMLPVVTKIWNVDGNSVSIRRVNGFHPSYAMNYHPHASLLRQLQIMIGAEACGILRSDWDNKDWMDELKRRCQELSESLQGKN
jgi:hypothetical protein